MNKIRHVKSVGSLLIGWLTGQARPSKGVKVWGKASQSCCGGPVVSHHPMDSLTAGWLGGLGPAKESRSGAKQAKAAVVDLWSTTIQRIASLSKGVKVWGKASQSCCGGPVVSHHPTDSLTAGWLGRLGPAKESRSGARQVKIQVEGIAYSFCGVWISSLLACLCVTSQLNSTVPGSIPGGLSI